MNMIIHLVIALISFQVSTINPTSDFLFEDPVTSVEINEVFGVVEGESVILKDTEIQLQLIKLSDSRCPEGVNCIRAGEIEVEIVIIRDDEVSEYTLRNPTWERGGTSEAKLDNGLVLRLNGAFDESGRQKGDPLRVAFVFTNENKKVDSPKSH